jgi:MFS family permease
MVKTLQEVHGFPQTRVTLLYLLGGLLAIAGNQAAGVWSDRVGRRPVLAGLLCLMAVAFAGFYNLHGWIVVPLWILQVFGLQGATVLVRALGSELFPTSYRTTASSARLFAATLGGSAGFLLESYLYGVLGSHAAAITALLPACPIAAALVFLLLPEPAARELEEVSPERGGS